MLYILGNVILDILYASNFASKIGIIRILDKNLKNFENLYFWMLLR